MQLDEIQQPLVLAGFSALIRRDAGIYFTAHMVWTDGSLVSIDYCLN
jgi:hypothetical protein